jgi:predicted ribonuclease YlaK
MIFYDTSALLDEENISAEPFCISIITLTELESIKTSSQKDESLKKKARKLTNELSQDSCTYYLFDFNEDFINKNHRLHNNNDSKIISSVLEAKKEYNDIIFITKDLSLKNLATFFKIHTIYKNNKKELYKGFQEINFNEQTLEDFYNSTNKAKFLNDMYNLSKNEYLFIRLRDKLINQYKFIDEYTIEEIPFYNFKSHMFGEVKPLDEYQHVAMDSLSSNKITLLRGNAGCGKSYLALGFLFYLLEHHEIDKIIIFCNTVATLGAAKLGYYPGDRDSKLLDSQIGTFLSSKLGSRYAVEQLIEQEKLILIPLSDARGYDTSGMKAGVYITEAQNFDIEMMRLTLQRIGEDSICIIDGDNKHQLDSSLYEGDRNGMTRVLDVFKGEKCFGTVELQNIHRSKIAEIAEKL